MKKLIIYLLALTSFQALAINCDDLAVHPNWPLNKVKTIISCDKVDSLPTLYSGDSACVFQIDEQVSNFNTTAWKIEFYNKKQEYVLISTGASIGKNGYKNSGKMNLNKDGTTSFESIYTPNGLILNTNINLQSPSELKLIISEKKFLKTTTLDKSTFRCSKIR